MKIIIVSLFALSLPSLLFAQQEPSKSSNGQVPSCALSKWSTTGAACDYAPDLLTTTRLVPPGFASPADGLPFMQPEDSPEIQKTRPLQDSVNVKPKSNPRKSKKVQKPESGVVPIGNLNPDHMPIVDSLKKPGHKNF